MRRPRGRVVLAVVFALLALSALVQVLLVPVGVTGGPAALTALQAAVAIAGAAAAWGSWSGDRWAPVAALAHGIATAVMLLSITPLLSLEPEASSGIRLGAACVLLFDVWAAWYLRRTAAPSLRERARSDG